MVDSYDYLLKFLIIGDASTGKTCILRRFIEDTFKEDMLHTIGVEFGTKVIQVGGESLKLQIWDTAGQERFQCVTRSYYRGAAGALVVYDISCRESFNRVADWISSVRELSKPDLAVILVGNKSDLAAERREVNEEEARQFARDNGVHDFIETSAKLGENIQEAFYAAARTALERAKATQSTDAFLPASSAGGSYLHRAPPGQSRASCSGGC
ncbi:Ras-related protein Rab-4B [Taenia solium]|eukprot:TsM_001042100 transcript=TsM_001042100 gene=TsM_001042100